MSIVTLNRIVKEQTVFYHTKSERDALEDVTIKFKFSKPPKHVAIYTKILNMAADNGSVTSGEIGKLCDKFERIRKKPNGRIARYTCQNVIRSLIDNGKLFRVSVGLFKLAN